MSLAGCIGGTPYRYRATQRLTVSARALQITLSVENRAGEALPFGFGLHPYFPDAEHATLLAACDSYWEIDPENLPLGRRAARGEMSFDDAQPLANRRLNHCFEHWRGAAVMEWRQVARSIRMTATRPLDFLQIYVPGRDYFCVEPVSHAVDAFNLASQGEADVGLVVLEEGETMSGQVSFEFLK